MTNRVIIARSICSRQLDPLVSSFEIALVSSVSSLVPLVLVIASIISLIPTVLLPVLGDSVGVSVDDMKFGGLDLVVMPVGSTDCTAEGLALNVGTTEADGAIIIEQNLRFMYSMKIKNLNRRG